MQVSEDKNANELNVKIKTIHVILRTKVLSITQEAATI